MDVQTLQAQKLDSVGRVAASAAHEINTQMQVVSDSLHFARGALTDLSSLVQQYRAAPPSASAEARTAIAQAEEAVDLPFLLQNAPDVVDRALEALAQVTTLVRSLREFAHPNQQEMTASDLNRAIRSTLTAARTEYKYVADVALDFAEIPPVICFIGDVNHAVLGIVLNAAQAIGETVGNTERRGLINVRTRHESDNVVITVADTGALLPSSGQHLRVDPVVSADVATGVARRLAIARLVVDQHGGDLTVTTPPGGGTLFVLRLPIAGPHPAKTAS